MKDAKGHGSNPRGASNVGVAPNVGVDPNARGHNVGVDRLVERSIGEAAARVQALKAQKASKAEILHAKAEHWYAQFLAKKRAMGGRSAA